MPPPPPDTSEALVVDRFIRELDAELRRYNATRQSWARLRLRVAIHFGRLAEADNGYAGPAPIAVTSLVNSDLLRGALLGMPDANIAVLLSPQVFEDTVATMATTLRPEQFRKVHISEPKFDSDAWLLVPDQDAHSVPLKEPDRGRPPAGPSTRNITFGAGGTQNYNEGTQYIGEGPR